MATVTAHRSTLKGTEVVTIKGTEGNTRPNALQYSPLRKLPDKAIVGITEFLPPASRVAFGRSCRHVYSVVEPVLESRNPHWEVLEVACPDHLECYHCRALHPIEKIHEYAYFNGRTKGGPTLQQRVLCSDSCWKMNERVRTAKYIHPNFSFTVFRMVMKRYRQGKDCDKLLEFLTYRSGALVDGGHAKQIIATPKIVGERLLMRSQTAYVLPPTPSSRIYLLNTNLVECPHTSMWSRDNIIVTAAIFQKFAQLETVLEGRREDIVSCRCMFCPTEFHFSLERFEGQGFVLFLSKWQDLGTGLSPLESDCPPVVGRHQDPEVARKGGKITYKSPRGRFEGVHDVSALSSWDRIELFTMSNSTKAQRGRMYNSFCWSTIGYGNRYPHLYGPGGECERRREY